MDFPGDGTGMSATIITEDHGDWLELTLNRPERLNSFNEDMYRAFVAALESAREARKRAILLTGSGRGFCAGQDLAERDPARMTGPPDLSRSLTDRYNPLVSLIRDLDCPVVCAVNGVAAGGGANLALACDIVLAAESARFIQSFAKIGLVPDSGGTYMLPRLVGEARAKALALTATPVSAAKAEDWGMIWRAVPDAALMGEARALTQSLGEGPTVGLALTKKAIQASATNTLEAQLAIEAESQKICGETPDYREGVRAFLDKRPPRFTGRR